MQEGEYNCITKGRHYNMKCGYGIRYFKICHVALPPVKQRIIACRMPRKFVLGIKATEVK